MTVIQVAAAFGANRNVVMIRERSQKLFSRVYEFNKTLARPCARILRALGFTANQVTVARALSPLPMLYLAWYKPDYAWTQILVFLAFAYTDLVDGVMAEMEGKTNDWGSILDPIADKCFIGTVYFLHWRKFPLIVLATMGVEAFQSAGFLLYTAFAKFFGRIATVKSIEANNLGKTKLVLEVATGALMLIHDLAPSRALAYCIFAMALAAFCYLVASLMEKVKTVMA